LIISMKVQLSFKKKKKEKKRKEKKILGLNPQNTN